MPDADNAKPLPIGQVVATVGRDYSNVTHSSLRFLERAGLIAPARTAGGHRLYSSRDIARVRQIKEWQAQHLSLAEIRVRLDAALELESSAKLAHRFVEEALGGNLSAAAAGVQRAAELGLPLAPLLQSVLRPALYEVGERWSRGEVRVGQEHEVSAVARDLVGALALRSAPPEPYGPIAVAACVAGEHHDLGLRMVASLLRAAGWRIHFLGGDVAPRFLREEVARRRPAVVLLSAALEARLPAMAAAIAAVGDGGGAPLVAAGGQAVPRHVDEVRAWGAIPITGDAIVADLAAALARVAEMGRDGDA